MKLDQMVSRFRIVKSDDFRLKDIDPADTCGLDLDKNEAKALLAEQVRRISKMQEKLYAQGRWSVLLVFQAMDAAGKDSAIKHVLSGINPQGCQVFSFKAPNAAELAHDYLWRVAQHLPERGHIGVFNRSHYEEVLVVRAHPEILARENLPEPLTGKNIWQERLEDIRSFERHLARNGTLILKFMLHISREEQVRRLLGRLDKPAKNWKFMMADVEERKLWDKYMDFYEETIRATSRPYAPWFVVPADRKWFARLMIAQAIGDAMEGLDLRFPEATDEFRSHMQTVRDHLAAQIPQSPEGPAAGKSGGKSGSKPARKPAG